MKLSVDHTKYLVGLANCVQTVVRLSSYWLYANSKVPYKTDIVVY